jgi:predicted lipoprotein with Yx(FWY)xxD motif
MRKAALLAVAGIGTLVIAGCGTSMDSRAGSSGQQAAPGGAAGQTVSIREGSGIGKVLVNAKGRTLYLDDQEKSGRILCAKADCTAIWAPLTIKGSKAPTGPADVNDRLGTIKRPDGITQVTLDGAPLYTFAYDMIPGDVKGNGQKDTFDGTSFSWHAATPNGPAGAQSTGDKGKNDDNKNNGGDGGYGYGNY